MEQSVLARLDGQIAWTARQWPHQMRQRLAGYILAQQTAGGGFTDKAGSPDLYYTGWALRGLWLIGGIDDHTRGMTGRYLQASPPKDLIELTSWLMAELAIQGSNAVQGTTLPTARLERAQGAEFRALLHASRSDDGGYVRAAGAPAGSTYLTFLALLTSQMLGEPLPHADRLLEFLRSRRREDGGFAEGPYARFGSVNPTAAAVATLLALSPTGGQDPSLEGACRFLQHAQHADGGWRAWPHSAGGDLLSTFTALYMLAAAGRLENVDAAGAVAFAQACLREDGSFAGTPAETQGDVEFTCYGISTLALLKVES